MLQIAVSCVIFANWDATASQLPEISKWSINGDFLFFY